jgi:membrane peptidoglycan carboxypeptidase
MKLNLCYHISLAFLKNDWTLIERAYLAFKNNKHKNHRILIQALIAAEDKRFYKHQGVDWLATTKAFLLHLFMKSQRGGSTIEQQLVRTIRKRHETTIKRKLSEIILSLSLNALAEKQEVTDWYLSIAYFGWRMTGIENALVRLKIESEKMKIEEACLIIACLKYPMPEKVSDKRSKQIQKRIAYILHKMNNKMKDN